MSSSNENTLKHERGQSWSRCGSQWGGAATRWSGVNIVVMVLGFVLFWPVGLLVLFWILSGRQVQELPGAIKAQWSRFFGNGREPVVIVDNVVFNEFQQTQYDRIREIKEEIKGRARRFSEFRTDARRRADQEEFNRFMASSPHADQNGRAD